MKSAAYTLALLLVMTASGYGFGANTPERTDSAEILFRQSRTELLVDFGNNRRELDKIRRSMEFWRDPDSTMLISNIRIEGSASPEGSVSFNRWLSEQRALRIADYIFPAEGLSNPLIISRFTGRNWGG